MQQIKSDFIELKNEVLDLLKEMKRYQRHVSSKEKDLLDGFIEAGELFIDMLDIGITSLDFVDESSKKKVESAFELEKRYIKDFIKMVKAFLLEISSRALQIASKKISVLQSEILKRVSKPKFVRKPVEPPKKLSPPLTYTVSRKFWDIIFNRLNKAMDLFDESIYSDGAVELEKIKYKMDRVYSKLLEVFNG